MNPNEPTEDLKAFERRLREIIDALQPVALRWRLLLLLISMFTAVSAWYWLWDAKTYQVSFFTSLGHHPLLILSCGSLVFLLMLGAHKKVVLTSIVASRCRTVLAEYNMSCDDSGKLILRPRPNT